MCTHECWTTDQPTNRLTDRLMKTWKQVYWITNLEYCSEIGTSVFSVGDGSAFGMSRGETADDWPFWLLTGVLRACVTNFLISNKYSRQTLRRKVSMFTSTITWNCLCQQMTRNNSFVYTKSYWWVVVMVMVVVVVVVAVLTTHLLKLINSDII